MTLRSLAESATPGEWFTGDNDHGETCLFSSKRGASILAILRQDKRHNAAFIAAASPSVVVGLLDRIEELERERATCDGSCDIALACRQVGPDGNVPGNARECAEMWEAEAARLAREVLRLGGTP